MQHQAAQAYQQTARKTANPRDLEANLLARSASQLHRVQQSWNEERDNLQSALTFNRKIWSVFMTSATKKENPLPDALKQNIANLGIFVMNHTLEVLAQPDPQKLQALININRELAAGLRGSPQAE